MTLSVVTETSLQTNLDSSNDHETLRRREKQS